MTLMVEKWRRVFSFQKEPDDVIVSKFLLTPSLAASSNNLSSIMTLKLSYSGINENFGSIHSLSVNLPLLKSKIKTSLTVVKCSLMTTGEITELMLLFLSFLKTWRVPAPTRGPPLSETLVYTTYIRRYR